MTAWAGLPSPWPGTPAPGGKPLIRRCLGRLPGVPEADGCPLGVPRRRASAGRLPRQQGLVAASGLAPVAASDLRRGLRPGTPVPTSKPLIRRHLSTICELSEPGSSIQRGGPRSVSLDAQFRGQRSPQRAQDGASSTNFVDLHSRSPRADADSAWWAALTPEQAKTEREWQSRLTALQFRVLRMKGTEEINTGPLLHWFASGSYACAGCGATLYRDEHKIQSTCGWPAFKDSCPGALLRHEGKKALEITCRGCRGHIGHIFKSDRHPLPHQERHCVNSASLKFISGTRASEAQDEMPGATGVLAEEDEEDIEEEDT
mmetsp:Transcript_24975/g.77670  ORF Transcript_24975/g.77670 Transcript_24975/m.77670 type:complete len:317 (+) Transcript_24975:47-997(+)